MATTTISYDNLFAGNFPVFSKRLTVLSGENVTKGTAMGKITASGKLTILDANAGDGSQNPYCIMAEDVDATGGDTVGLAYLAGGFNENKITFNSGEDADTHFDAFRDLGIYLIPSSAADV